MAKARKSKSTKNLRDLRDPLDYPETRIERYLKCIKTGDNTDLPSTVNTRIERYLYCIATGNNSTLPDHPETMIELYLDAIATGNVSDLPYDPQDRLQRYLYAAAYVDSSLLPSADYTRLEKYISSILGGTTFVTEQAPYLFRVSGGDENANVKHKELDTLVGVTMPWNQLVDVGTTEVTIPSGHKYFAIISGTTSIGASAGIAISVTGGTDILTDLTLMLGPTIADYVYTLESGTPGAGVEWLKSHGFFTKPYYAYDAGSLQSVCVSAHRMTEFNQWDEQTELGYFDLTTGEPKESSTTIRTKNAIHVIGSTSYYFRCGSVATDCFRVIWYDGNDNFISSNSSPTNTNTVITSPTNAAYMRFYTTPSYGTTYKNDICINLSQPDTSVSPHNGEYLPFTLHTYALDHSVARRGIYKLDANNKLYADGDTDDGKGTMIVKRKRIDLGTLNWSRSTSYANPFFYCNLDSNPDETVHTYTYNFVGKSGTSAFGDEPNMSMALSETGTQLYVRNDSYSIPADFKTAMSGIYIEYSLKTPTTATVEPFTYPQQVDKNGTEEYVDFPYFVEDRDVEVPVGHITQYPQ